MLGIKNAQFGPSCIDGFHGYVAVNKHLADKLQIRGHSANIAMWAFRLWTRSQSESDASRMRDLFVVTIIDLAAVSPDPPWTLPQASDYVKYFLTYWHGPPAWSDLFTMTNRVI